MAKTISMKMPSDLVSRADAVASKLGTNRSALVKLLLLSFLIKFEKDGVAMLPPNWEELLWNLDSRHFRYDYPEQPIRRVAENSPCRYGTSAQKTKPEEGMA
jgi:hypothetical protein